MSQLPFKTQPRKATKTVGNDEWGTLEFPVFGDLIVGERLLIDEAENRYSIFKVTATAAVEIAKIEELSYLEAHSFVTKCVLSAAGLEMTQRERELNVKYAELLTNVGESVIKASYEKIAIWATAIIQHRLDGMDGWTQERTLGLPQGLVNEIYNFGQAEAESQQKSQESKDEENARLEEELGKLRMVLGSLPNAKTGPLHTGSVGDIGQPPPSSTQTASQVSEAPTLNRQSRRAARSTAKSTTSTKLE